MSRVIFLDIDGVLNSARTAAAFGGYPMCLANAALFDPVAVGMLRGLCRGAGIDIVLSSAWRTFCNVADVARVLDLPIVDATPDLPLECRGVEIARWLEGHVEVEHYVIVDDDADMLPEQLPHFVQTSPKEGLSWANFDAICRRLGVSPYDALVPASGSRAS